MNFRIIIILLFTVLFQNCGKPFVGEGVVVFLSGSLKLSAGGSLQQESRISSRDTIKVGQESLADIQFPFPEDASASAVVRLDENARFSFIESNPKKSKDLTFRLPQGSATFKVNQLAEKLLFTIETPAAGFLVHKGEFQIFIAPNGDTTIQSLMGSAQGYRRIPDKYLENIPESFLSEVVEIKDTMESWKKELTPIATGQTVTIFMAENEERFQKAGLQSALDKAKKAIENNVEVVQNPAKLKELAKEIKQEFTSNVEARKYIETSMKEELPFKVEKLSISDLKKKLKEVENLTYIDPQKIAEAKNLTELIQQRNKDIKPSLMNRVATLKSGSVGKLKTSDGRELECVVYTNYNDPDYFICDPVTGGKEEKFHKTSASLRFLD